MSRRPHKKSKNGCLDCKRRHIRCDANRPICTNCSGAEIRCSFLDKNTPMIIATVPHHPANPAPCTDVFSTPAESRSTSKQPSPHENYKSGNLCSVNMTHLRLFNNLFSQDFRSIERPPDVNRLQLSTDFYIKHALEAPYLMHQLLAISALQLAVGDKAAAISHRESAISLQNSALSMLGQYNHNFDVTAQTCVPLFLFSTLVGIHLLCDASHFHRSTFEEFIEHFSHGLSVYRGVLAITESSLQPLHASELGPYLLSSEAHADSPVCGSDCDVLLDLVASLEDSNPLKDVYRETVLRLQKIFDAEREASSHQVGVSVIIEWPLFFPATFVDCLRQQRAPAIVILAHYAVILHHSATHWLFGDVGRFLIEAICTRLGSDWEVWLKTPMAVLETVG